jgi:hypothetical protein
MDARLIYACVASAIGGCFVYWKWFRSQTAAVADQTFNACLLRIEPACTCDDDAYCEDCLERKTARQVRTDCPLCGESLCAHGFCRNLGDAWQRGACDNAFDADDNCCQECAEAQQQQWFEDYYGGNGPQTDREREELRGQL